MKLRENMKAIFNVLRQDENLLRLLYYAAKDVDDNVLEVTAERPLILDKPPNEVWDIVNDRIKFTPKTSDLDESEKCRLLIYPHRRKPQSSNYVFATQEVIIDILVHESFEVDFRREWLSDHIDSLLFDKRITGLGKVKYVDGSNASAPIGYIGQRLVYSFGSVSG